MLRNLRLHGGRRSAALLVLLAAEVLLALALGLSGTLADAGDSGASARANRSLVSTLGLTDLALFPGASYSRHPSQADRHAPFSDHPAAFEHSPAGSLLPVPPAPRTPRAAPTPRATGGRQ